MPETEGTEELDLIQLAAATHNEFLCPLLLNASEDQKQIMDTQLRQELKLRLEPVDTKILEMKQNGKFGVDACVSLNHVWWNWVESNRTAISANAMLLMELTAKCVFGGGWIVVQENVKAELMNSISSEGNRSDYTNDQNVLRFRKMCRGMVHIIQHNVWSAPYLEKIFNSTDLTIDLEAVNEMWSVEDCEFIKVRVEWLCVVSELKKAKALVQGSILKFLSNYGHSPEIAVEGAAMSSSDFLEFGTIFVLLSVKLNQDLTSVQNLFPFVIRNHIADRLIADVDSNRIAAKWKKGWKYKDDIAQGWVEKILWEMVTVPTANLLVWSGIHSTATTWLRLAQRLNQQKYLAGVSLTCKAHMYNLTPVAQQQLSEEAKKFLNTVPVEVIDDLCKNVRDQSYLFCFAAALKQFGLSTPGILSKCVKLCVDALQNQSNELELLRIGNSPKTEIAEKEIALAKQYEELAVYFTDNLNENFEGDAALAFDVILTSFSLNPTEELLQKLKNLAKKRPTVGNSRSLETDDWDEAVWEPVSSSKKSVELGIPETTLETLICVTTNSRLSNFNTVCPSWSFYEPLCSKHFKTRGSEILDLNDLEMARPDYSKFTYSKENYDDEMIFETGFEPTAGDSSDDKTSGKPVRRKEPQSRLREWRKCLRNRENVKAKDELPLKKLKPSSQKRRYVRSVSAGNLVRKRSSVVRKKEDERTKLPTTEESFTEGYERFTLQALRVDICALRDVQEGQKVLLSTSELMRKLSLEDNPNLSKGTSQPESSNFRRTPKLPRQSAPPVRKPSLNSQRRAEQLQASLNSIHTFSATPLDYSAVGTKKNAVAESGKAHIMGTVPIFTHLMSSLQRIKQPDVRGVEVLTITTDPEDPVPIKNSARQSDDIHESTESDQNRTHEFRKQNVRTCRTKNQNGRTLTTRKKVPDKSLPPCTEKSKLESKKRHGSPVLQEDDPFESKEDECDQITKIIQESGLNNIEQPCYIQPQPSGEEKVHGDEQTCDGGSKTVDSIEQDLPTFLEPEVMDAEVEDIENYLSNLKEMEYKQAVKEQRPGSKPHEALSDPRELDGSLESKQGEKDELTESARMEDAAAVALMKLGENRTNVLENEIITAMEPKEPRDNQPRQAVCLDFERSTAKAEDEQEDGNSTASGTTTVTADEDADAQTGEDHSTPAALLLPSESSSRDQAGQASFESRNSNSDVSKKASSLYKVIAFSSEDNQMDSNIDVDLLELNPDEPRLPVEIDLTSEIEENTWRKTKARRRPPVEEIKLLSLPSKFPGPENLFDSSSYGAQPTIFPGSGSNANIIFDEEEVRVAAVEVEKTNLSRNDEIWNNSESERLLSVPRSKEAEQSRPISSGIESTNLNCFVNVPRLEIAFTEVKTQEVDLSPPQVHSKLKPPHPSLPEIIQARINDITNLQPLINNCDEQRPKEQIDNLKSDGNGDCSLLSSPAETECPVLEPTDYFSHGEFSSPSATDDEVSPPALDCYPQPTHMI